MYERDDIIEKLGIQEWPEDKQNEVLEVATHRIGLAVTENLTEAQFNEYQSIVDDDEAVIFAWLEQNIPEYKQSPVFQEFENSVDDDPERNRPEKLFASIAWIQMNVPNVQELIEKALTAYREELSHAA